MLTLICLMAVCEFHTPAPDDWQRFGLIPQPCYRDDEPSPARDRWNRSVRYREWVRSNGSKEEYAYAEWVSLAWYHADDLVDSNLPIHRRVKAAIRLKEIIGPVDYYFGKLPEPTMPGER